ncbi:NLR family CARD domain-containing protein 3-like [Stylophora pistillata]|uniref:Protein NLRC3 n=1 Tax=Stylophora pistillata TaxID=50429 RepID=A0A2B4RT84_STYPI|nr:NLR family CARD domain-containing protein 3-like [Stylophora pistillata]XP_022796868.1 NLR family CARD domain-containing protein 3-like [Stylophora pistillata]PFX21644.1 Protein NLRC3 [Stylophora pistillata]
MASGPPSVVSSKETTNYARLCRLLVDVGSQVLRDTFDGIHPPVGLHSVLAGHPNHAKLQSLQKKKVINPKQWGKLFPVIPASVSSAGFDITLLVVLLRNICGLSPPSSGWDHLPPVTEGGASANIARVKFYRNTVYGHAEQAVVDDTKFDTLWQDIGDAIVGLGGAKYAAAINKLKNECMDPDMEKHYKELLSMWKRDEDNIKEKLHEVEGKLEHVKEQVKNVSKTLDAIFGSKQAEDDVDPSKLVDEIRQLYKVREGWLAPFPWCEDFCFHLGDIYTRLRVVNRKKAGRRAEGHVVTMSEIFKSHEECESPRTSLIEGKPGMGKTTYCKKLVYSWAVGKEETGGFLPSFKIVLFIKCRDVKGDLWAAIDDQLLPRDIDEAVKGKFFNFIRRNQSEVLLVLDGLDEVSASKLPMFAEIIQGRILPNCYLVATARHEAGVKVRIHCDTLLEVEGFTEEDVRNFIMKYFKTREDLAKTLIEEIEKDKKLKDMSANPLNTALFCLVCEDFEGVFPESRTELYVEIVQCVLRRYKRKKQLPENGEDLIEEYRTQLKHLGGIALNGLLEDNLDFDDSELGNHKSDLPKFGFLSVQPGGSKLRPRRRYAFLHKSFQEWFAAHYLCRRLIAKEISPSEIAVDKHFIHQLKEVLPFVFGMLSAQCEETTVILVKSIATHVNQEVDEVRDGWFRVVLDCIKECKEDNDLPTRLSRVFGSLLQLECVSLERSNVGDPDVVILTEALKTNTTITSLHFSFNVIGAGGAVALAEALSSHPSLRVLNLSTNRILGNGASALAGLLKCNSTLTELLLPFNNITDTGADGLAEALKCNTSLSKLNLNFNNIGHLGAATIADAIKCNETLTELRLSGNKIGDTGAACLADAIRVNTYLKMILLDGGDIGIAGATDLAEALKCNQTLTELGLHDNNIGDSGTTALAAALKCNNSLERLDLSRNKITDRGALALSNVLKCNTILKELYLARNGIGYRGVAALADEAKGSTTLTKLNLSGNKDVASVVQELRSKLGNLNE